MLPFSPFSLDLQVKLLKRTVVRFIAIMPPPSAPHVISPMKADRRFRHPLETNADTISEVLAYCQETDFLFLAGVSSSWNTCWERTGRRKRTSVSLATTTATRVEGILDQPSFHAAAAHLGGVFCLAAQAGNLGGLKTAAREFGEKWTSLGAVVAMTAIAASKGHVGILEWAVLEGCPLSAHTMRCGIEGGHLDVVEWGAQQGCPFPEDSCHLAALGGHLDILKLARAQKLPWGETCMAAAEAGHIEVLRFARRNGCPWDSSTSRAAAWGNHFEVLQWVVAQGCSVDKEVCHGAAMSGNLPMLQWLRREGGGSFDCRTCSYAALGGNLEVLKWLKNEDCPWDEDTAACATQVGTNPVL